MAEPIRTVECDVVDADGSIRRESRICPAVVFPDGGSEQYCDPHQNRTGQQLIHKDWWSLGLTLAQVMCDRSLTGFDMREKRDRDAFFSTDLCAWNPKILEKLERLDADLGLRGSDSLAYQVGWVKK